MRTLKLNLNDLEDRLTPSGVPSTWQTRGSGGGGALFSPAFNPADPNEIYVASDMSQIFRTTTGGAAWTPVDYRELQANHESKVQFTNNPLIRYTIDYTGETPRPTKTTDGGATWTPMASDPTGGEAYYLYADPADANRLVVTDYSSVYYSGNGGASWSLKYTTASGGGILLGGAFWDGSAIYLGTNQGLIVSTNNGATFAVEAHSGVPAGQSIISFAGGKSGSTVKFVAVTYNTADVYAGLPGYDNGSGGNGQVITMTYGAAASWAVQSIPAGSYPFYAGMARNNASVMYVAGGSSNGTPVVLKSTGSAFTNTLLTTNNANIATGWSGQGGDRGWTYGETPMGFAVSDTDANRVIITDYGFAHSSTDGGANWAALYVAPADRNAAGAGTPTGKSYHDSGLDNTTAWQVAWTGGSTMMIANSDIRGQRSTDNGLTFGFGYTGHTENSLYRIAKSANGTLYGASGTRHDLYQSTTLRDDIDAADGGVLMSTNNGGTWTMIKDFNDVVSWVAVDPNNPNRVYASVVNSTTGGIWRSDNANLGTGSTWTKLPNPARTQGHPFNIIVLNDGNVLATYSGRRDSAGAFTASSGVYLYNTASGLWADRSAAGQQYWTKDVIVDPADSTQSTWYAGVFSGWGGPPNGLGGLYKTTDRGANWTRTLNLDRITSATINPADTSEIFITTETEGLWHSNNFRTASPVFTQAGSYPFRQPERVFFNPTNASEIWVTSFGGGVMVGSTAAATTVTATAINGGASQRSRLTTINLTFNNPVNAATLAASGGVTLTRTSGGPATVVQTGATGANGRITLSPATGNVNSVTLTFDNANGSAVTPGVESGSLADGRWQLAIPGINYTSVLNDVNLRRLFGDANANGTVAIDDLTAFGNAFNTNGVAFDYDANGTVDIADLAAFGNRFALSV